MPKAAVSTCSKTAALFDQLVGEQLDRVGHLDAESLGRLQVDDELEPGRQPDRHFGRFLALEDAARIDAGLAKPVRKESQDALIRERPARWNPVRPRVAVETAPGGKYGQANIQDRWLARP